MGCLIACSLAAMGCSSPDGGTLATLSATGRITVAIAIEPPYMTLGPGGIPQGIGPEIDRAVLAAVGIRELKPEVMEFGAMIPALQARRVDMVSAGGLNITAERCRSIAFAEPSGCSPDVFILSRELAGTITSYRALATNPLAVATCAGCTQQKEAIAAGVPANRVVSYVDGRSAMALLTSRRIDVIALDLSAGKDLYGRIADPSSLQLVRVSDGRTYCGGAAFRLADTELREAYNEGLRKIIANGTYLEILKKYHHEESAVTAQTPPTAQLCAG